MRVFLTGGTGLIGSRLVRRLHERGDSVVLLTRRSEAAQERFGKECTIVAGDPMQAGAWQEAIADCAAVVNLAGESVFGSRWNTEFKALLRESRILSTQHVVQALSRAPVTSDGQPKTLVNASAIGYYGPHGDEELTEESPGGDDMLARLCLQWEKQAREAESAGVRVAIVRVGVVLDPEGGALPQMLRPFKLTGIGGPVGSGRQYVSWIHHADVVGLLLLALDRADARGPINGTAPNPVTSWDMARAIGRVLHRPSFLPAPAFALRLALGEVADLVTTGQRVLPPRAQALGYAFRFPTVETALADLLGR
jgi:uncharacterized protein (TIGR01777 family)